ncbi:uncharacterized protein LOC104266575 [Ciona intestinalis]
MQCSPSPSYSVNIILKDCRATNQVNVTSSKSEYNSVGSVSCSSGSELFYKVSGSLVVDRTTTCNAYAEWTNIHNMQCSKGPNTTSIIGNYTVQAGSTASLECIYSGEVPAATYTRFYFNQTTTNVTKSSTWESPPLQASDNNKVVECQAVNQYTNYFNQSHRANITLNVTYAPQNVTIEIISASPHILKVTSGYKIRSDHTLSTVCRSNSNPQSIYQIMYCLTDIANCLNGQTYNGVNPNTTFSVFCVAKNAIGQAESKKYLISVVPTARTVKFHHSGSHSIQNNFVQPPIHESVSILCNIEYQQQLNTTFTWKLPNNTLRTQPMLYLASVSKEDTGIYTCTTDDAFGRYSSQIHIDVLYPPETRNISIICHWAIGTAGECIVEFTSNPKADSFILKMGNVFITSGVSLTAQQHKTQQFIFRKIKVSETDFGIYQLTLTSNIFPHNAFVMNITIASLYNKAKESDTGYVTIIVALSSITAVIIISLATVYYWKKTRNAKVAESTSTPNRIYATIADEHRNTVTTNGITHVYETTPASLYTFAETSEKRQANLEGGNKNVSSKNKSNKQLTNYHQNNLNA